MMYRSARLAQHLMPYSLYIQARGHRRRNDNLFLLLVKRMSFDVLLIKHYLFVPPLYSSFVCLCGVSICYSSRHLIGIEWRL